MSISSIEGISSKREVSEEFSFIGGITDGGVVWVFSGIGVIGGISSFFSSSLGGLSSSSSFGSSLSFSSSFGFSIFYYCS